MQEEEEEEEEEVRRLADEDAVRMRDILSRHLMESGGHTMAVAEADQQAAAVASGSGDGNNEQGAC